MGECDARRIEATRTLSEEDRLVQELVRGLIPIVKRRIGVVLDRSRENVEEELATLADLLVIQDHLRSIP